MPSNTDTNGTGHPTSPSQEDGLDREKLFDDLQAALSLAIRVLDLPIQDLQRRWPPHESRALYYLVCAIHEAYKEAAEDLVSSPTFPLIVITDPTKKTRVM